MSARACPVCGGEGYLADNLGHKTKDPLCPLCLGACYVEPTAICPQCGRPAYARFKNTIVCLRKKCRAAIAWAQQPLRLPDDADPMSWLV